MSAVTVPFQADCRLPARIRPAVNVEARRGGPIDILLLHYTGLPSAEQSIGLLACAESRVSCHYVIDVDGTITQMVPECLRAWHAGVSRWGSETDINSRSIGIEIQNTGHPAEGGRPPPFPDEQIQAVIALGRDIASRHAIVPARVLAHSDVAPDRKIDPGEDFPWKRLADAGLGAWVAPEPLDPCDVEWDGGQIATAQSRLRDFGYGIEPTGELDAQTVTVLKAFQRHFRPECIDGRLDRSTWLTLERLIETYGRGVAAAVLT